MFERVMVIALLSAGLAASASEPALGQSGETTTTTYDVPGTYGFDVPGGVCEVAIEVYGAQGGSGIAGGGTPGLGGGVGATFPAMPGQQWIVFVGSQGGSSNGGTAGGAGGVPDGGPGGTSVGGSATAVGGGGGGGRSIVIGHVVGSGIPAFGISAGGGGGSSYSDGGDGGGTRGRHGENLDGFGGGGGGRNLQSGQGGGSGPTQGQSASANVGGAGGPGQDGTLSGGGGGGGGFLAGGGGFGDGDGLGGRGGGGGAGQVAVPNPTFAQPTAVAFDLPENDGDGRVVFAYSTGVDCAPPVAPAPVAIEPAFTG